MNKEELEKDYYADRPTEPYSNDDSPNDWANIAHYAEENLEKAFKQISELEAENEQIKNSDTLCKLIGEQKRKITELEQQIEKMKTDYEQLLDEKIELENSLAESRECY